MFGCLMRLEPAKFLTSRALALVLLRRVRSACLNNTFGQSSYPNRLDYVTFESAAYVGSGQSSYPNRLDYLKAAGLNPMCSGQSSYPNRLDCPSEPT